MEHLPKVYVDLEKKTIKIDCRACPYTTRTRLSREFAWIMFRAHAMEFRKRNRDKKRQRMDVPLFEEESA